MQTKVHFRALVILAVLMVLAQACSGSAAQSPTAAPTFTPVPPTATVPPTSTTEPTATPNLAATQAMNDILTQVQKYVDAGYLPSTQGEVADLSDGSLEMAKTNYLDFQDAGYEEKVKNFAVWTDLKINSAAPVNYPEYSGCGFTFHFDESGDSYTAMVTKDQVLLTACRNHSCYELGKTKGSGRLNFSDAVDAKLELIVNDVNAWVRVDDQLIGQYTLSSDYLTEPGYLAYTIISGTNKDYGTRCEFSHGKLWLPSE